MYEIQSLHLSKAGICDQVLLFSIVRPLLIERGPSYLFAVNLDHLSNVTTHMELELLFVQPTVDANHQWHYNYKILELFSKSLIIEISYTGSSISFKEKELFCMGIFK